MGLSEALGERSVEHRVWELIAWLGRYANQPADVCLGLTLRQLKLMSKFTSRILKDETAPLK